MAQSNRRRDDSQPANLSGFVVTGWTLAAGLSLVAAFGAYQTFVRSVPLERVVVQIPPDGLVDTIQTGSIPTDSSNVISALEKQAAQMKREIAAFRRTSASLRQQNTVLNQRIARLESLVGEVTGSISRTPTAETSNNLATTDRLPRATSGRGEQADVVSKELPFPINPPETVDAASIPGASSGTNDLPDNDVIAGRSQFAVDLGGFSSLASLEHEWKRLSERKLAPLEDLAPRAALKDTDSRLSLRLLAGPFRNAVTAATVCARLRQEGLTCAATIYHGQALKGTRTAGLTDSE
ncbi:SPOR domain-containing protein [Coralliovum pocilloporae]|uniref:SPOR domain-containing protein n=1 Tax=Coralliovum pocilloporae TaxID=3066369 RepID=UPI0033076FD6